MTIQEAIEGCNWFKKNDYHEDTSEVMDMAIKALEEQYKHRWIPVSEGLPPEHDTMFAKFKGTPKWNNSMFEKCLMV